MYNEPMSMIAYGWKISDDTMDEFITNSFDEKESCFILNELKILLKEFQVNDFDEEYPFTNIECVIPNLIIDYDISTMYIGKLGDDNKTPKEWAKEVLIDLLDSKIPETLKQKILTITHDKSPKWIIYEQ